MPTTDITWQNLTNAVINGSGHLEKNAGSDNCFTNASGTGDAGARSVETITAGDFEFQCTLGPLDGESGRSFVGLDNGTFSLDFTLWQACIHVSTESNTSGTPHPENSVFVYEGNPPNKTYQDGIWNEGDLLRIVVSGGVVRYYINSLLLYTSSITLTYPVSAVASLACLNKTVINPKFITSGGGTGGSGSSTCEMGDEKLTVELCGRPWVFPTTSPLPVPSNGGPQPRIFQEIAGDYGEFGQNFPDGKTERNTIQTAPIRRWVVEWDCDVDEAQELDEHYYSTYGGLEFSITNPNTLETTGNVRYESYEVGPHRKEWAQSRIARLVRYIA